MTPRDILGMVMVVLLLGGLLAVVAGRAKAGKLSPEMARKSVHAGMGLVCLSFPWIFSGPTPVMVLAVLATAGLLALRWLPVARASLGASVHGVGRRSGGELFFPVAVAVVFWLTGDQRAFYYIAVLVLTVSDALGALVGSRYGQFKYEAWHGSKSLEGSVLFFASAFLCCHLVLLLATPTPRLACVWIALGVAVLATAIEGILGDGWDNLLVPLGTLLVLDQLHDRSVDEQATAVAVIFAIFGLLWSSRRWSSLNGGAMLAGLLYGAACLAWGGVAFLAAPLAMFFLHLVVTRVLAPRRKFHHAADTILFLALPILAVLAAHHAGAISRDHALIAHTGAIAAQLVQMHGATRRALGLGRLRPWFGLGKVLLFVFLPAVFLLPTRGMVAAQLAVAVVLYPMMRDAFRHGPDSGPASRGHHPRRATLSALAALLAAGATLLAESARPPGTTRLPDPGASFSLIAK